MKQFRFDRRFRLAESAGIMRMGRHVMDRFFRLALIICGVACLLGCSTKYTINADDYQGYRGEINQHARLIHADRQKIFHLLTDEKAFTTLCPEGTVVAFEEPLPYQQGTIVATRIKHIFKLGWTSRVEEVVPGDRIRLSFRDGFFAGGTELWELEDADGGTRVRQTIIVSPRGVIRSIFWNLKVRLKHNIMVEAFLDKLKARAESP
jgi:uncharacterized protein YndB with AHSA1/START domain